MPVLWHRLPSRVADLFFPKACLGCGRAGEYLCPACLGQLPRLLPPLCPRCGQPVAVEPCPACHGRRLAVDGIYSPFRFEGLVREAVHRLKYHNLRAVAPLLGSLMAAHLRRHSVPAEAVVPVPLHRGRLRQRGYNQAELLARPVARELGVPVVGWLERPRPGPPQVKVASREERWHNASGAFHADPAARGRRLVVVDDVCTSGATLNACAHALKAAGAVAVWGLTLAREI